MERPVDIGKKALEHKQTELIPRAELWLGSEIFKEYGLTDDIEGHLRVRKMFGMDIFFMPVSDRDTTAQFQSYRYFSSKELKKALEISKIPVGVIIDGPFQRLTENKGLMNVFSEWIKKRNSIEKEFQQEANLSMSLVIDVLEHNPSILVIADDIAYEKGIYMSYEDMERLFKPFYSQAVKLIHAAGAYALYHSCGNLTKIIPNIISYGFDGLAACQGSSMDMPAIKKEYGNRLTFLTGIDGELFQMELIDEKTEKHFLNYIQGLTYEGGVILCSSCGLYSKAFLRAISDLYRITEKAKVKLK